jgi:hypothetical protein
MFRTIVTVNFIATISSKYDKQDQQGKAAFKERNPHTTQQQEPVARSQDGLQAVLFDRVNRVPDILLLL